MSVVTKKKPARKKRSRSLFYRIAAWLHLWLGLVTGLVMIVVCLTGCIWVFNEEINALLNPQTKVAWKETPVMMPSQIKAVAEKAVPGKRINYASYQQGRGVDVALGERRKGTTVVSINPFDGEVLNKKEFQEGETNFFRFIIDGHRFLWLPYEIGRPIVNYSTLIFVIILISGLVLWWPKKWNKSTRAQSFTIKWGASVKRINYDLHNVVGFYSLLLLLILCLTGMVWGIQWYSKGLYWATSGGQTLPEYPRFKSDSLQAGKFYTSEQAMDIAWEKVISGNPAAEGFFYSYPNASRASATINITIYPEKGQFYQSRSYTFDQHTLEELKGHEHFAASFEEASFGTKLRRMNYDIHVGSILGLPGKFLAFFVSLIGASLPVTGFVIWWGKKKKQQPKKKKTPSSGSPATKTLYPNGIREYQASAN